MLLTFNSDCDKEFGSRNANGSEVRRGSRGEKETGMETRKEEDITSNVLTWKF